MLQINTYKHYHGLQYNINPSYQCSQVKFDKLNFGT